MVELATIAMNTTYTGNEPWVAKIEKVDMIYVESNYGNVGTDYGMITQIYSSASFKKLLDEGRTMTQATGAVYIVYNNFGSNSRYARLYNSTFKGNNVSSIKIYGVTL